MRKDLKRMCGALKQVKNSNFPPIKEKEMKSFAKQNPNPSSWGLSQMVKDVKTLVFGRSPRPAITNEPNKPPNSVKIRKVQG